MWVSKLNKQNQEREQASRSIKADTDQETTTVWPAGGSVAHTTACHSKGKQNIQRNSVTPIFTCTAEPTQALNYIITHDMIRIDITFNSSDCTLTKLHAGWNPECSQSAISWMRPQAPQALASFNKEINRKYIAGPPRGCACSHLRSERNIVKIQGNTQPGRKWFDVIETLRCDSLSLTPFIYHPVRPLHSLRSGVYCSI